MHTLLTTGSVPSVCMCEDSIKNSYRRLATATASSMQRFALLIRTQRQNMQNIRQTKTTAVSQRRGQSVQQRPFVAEVPFAAIH